MTEILGWQVVVDNRSGAGGTIAVATAVRALPDGYTMVMGETANLAVNPALYSKLSFNPLKDLSPITLVASSIPNLVSTPAPIVKRLVTDIGPIVQLPEVRERMAGGGGTIRPGPAEFKTLLKAEHAKWAQIVKESGAKLD